MARSMHAARAVLLVFAAHAIAADAAAPAGEVSKSCKYEASDCVSGSATARFVDGRLSAIELDVFYCGPPGNPGYSCSMTSRRGDGEWTWSDAGNQTTLRNATPFNDTQPDAIVVTVGKNVSIDFANAQSAGPCGAGAQWPAAIVVPEDGGRCRVFDRR